MTAKSGSDAMEYRVENKYLVSDADITVLSARLRQVMDCDIHQTGSCYQIRSLYFDDHANRCMQENDAGVDIRKKYRIRTYDPDSGVIHLEIKEKANGLTKKRSCSLDHSDYCQLCNGTMPFVRDGRSPINELMLQHKCTGMAPKAIVAYERTAFVHPTGNVRVTFDRNILASDHLDSFFDERISGLVPVLPAGMHVLEVKCDELLPDFIARQLELGKLRQTAFSKYYLGRLALQGSFAVDW